MTEWALKGITLLTGIPVFNFTYHFISTFIPTFVPPTGWNIYILHLEYGLPSVISFVTD
jgi:hypothetical protein